jgi:DNA-directed RNA polymerase specialized sigma24 family protein
VSDYGTITPIDVPEDQKLELESFMAKAFGTLLAAANERASNLQVMADATRVLRLRDDFKKGRCNLRRSPDAAGVMKRLIEIEQTVIAGFIRVGHSLFVAFDTHGAEQRPGVIFGDYVQEGSHGIYDAMYTFSGEGRFSTYAYYCMKNRLSSFVRKEENKEGGGVSHKIKSLRKRLRRMMRECNLSVEQALSRIKATDDLDNVIIDKLSESLHRNSRLTTQEVADRSESPEFEMMREFIEVTELEPLERTMIEGKLEHGRQFTSMFQQTPEGINPETRKPFTRAWLSQVYLAACEKLQEAYNGAGKREAA